MVTRGQRIGYMPVRCASRGTPSLQGGEDVKYVLSTTYNPGSQDAVLSVEKKPAYWVREDGSEGPPQFYEGMVAHGQIEPNKPFKIGGYVFEGSTGLAGLTVRMSIILPSTGGTVDTLDVTTANDGRFDFASQISRQDTYDFYFDLIDDMYIADQQMVGPILCEEIVYDTMLTVALTPPSIFVGDSVTVSGFLSYEESGQLRGMIGEPVKVEVALGAPNNVLETKTVTTGGTPGDVDEGKYETSFTLITAGSYFVRAVYEGGKK